MKYQELVHNSVYIGVYTVYTCKPIFAGMCDDDSPTLRV